MANLRGWEYLSSCSSPTAARLDCILVQIYSSSQWIYSANVLHEVLLIVRLSLRTNECSGSSNFEGNKDFCEEVKHFSNKCNY